MIYLDIDHSLMLCQKIVAVLLGGDRNHATVCATLVVDTVAGWSKHNCVAGLQKYSTAGRWATKLHWLAPT